MEGLCAPQDGRVYRISVPVNESRSWHDMVTAAAPRTPANCTIFKVGNQYHSTQESRTDDIALVNFGSDVSGMEALEWAATHSLQPTTPWQCFAVAEHNPKLYEALLVPSLAVVSLDPCSYNGQQMICRVWIERIGAESHIGSLYVQFIPIHWFAFIHKPKPVA